MAVEQTPFWQTLPAILTGIVSVLTAAGGLVYHNSSAGSASSAVSTVSTASTPQESSDSRPIPNEVTPGQAGGRPSDTEINSDAAEKAQELQAAEHGDRGAQQDIEDAAEHGDLDAQHAIEDAAEHGNPWAQNFLARMDPTN